MDITASGAQAVSPPLTEGGAQVTETPTQPIEENSAPSEPPIVEGATPASGDAVSAPGEHKAFEPMMPPPPPTPVAAEAISIPQSTEPTPAIAIPIAAGPTAQDQINRPTLETPPIPTQPVAAPVPTNELPPLHPVPASPVANESVVVQPAVDSVSPPSPSAAVPLVPTAESQALDQLKEAQPVAPESTSVEVTVPPTIPQTPVQQENKLDLAPLLAAQQKALQETPSGTETALAEQKDGLIDEEVSVSHVQPLTSARSLETIAAEESDEAVEGVVGSRQR